MLLMLLMLLILLLPMITSSRWARVVALMHVVSFALIGRRYRWSRIVLPLGTEQLIVDTRRLEAIQILQTHPHILVQDFH
uniref:Putative secreted protein n=3 Tax=Anopheles marajoara TaxID=58244 RepID=A0A2M4CBX4_9DIPT